MAGRDPIGKRSCGEDLLTIVGVAKDTRDAGIGSALGPILYLPYAQNNIAGVSWAPSPWWYAPRETLFLSLLRSEEPSGSSDPYQAVTPWRLSNRCFRTRALLTFSGRPSSRSSPRSASSCRRSGSTA